ncbi:RDD family protein [Aureibacter tunicatorum]|uniref:RDD family protein n=1 Tax=Aureibacter tunicatorum TaxID=866807 RepID=UPI00286C2239|nr:RDD family protein [Aureibacter tunicatorum]
MSEVLFAKTIGKAITKTTVVNEDGKKPSPKEVALRTLCRFVPFEAFSFLNDDAYGIHDKWSKTLVVNDK